MKELVDLLHLLYCNKPHAGDMLELGNRQNKKCYYYLENDLADSESQEDHIEWGHITDGFKASLNLLSDEEALEFVKSCIRLSQDFNKLVEDSKYRRNFIKSLLLLGE